MFIMKRTETCYVPCHPEGYIKKWYIKKFVEKWNFTTKFTALNFQLAQTQFFHRLQTKLTNPAVRIGS